VPPTERNWRGSEPWVGPSLGGIKEQRLEVDIDSWVGLDLDEAAAVSNLKKRADEEELPPLCGK